MSKTPDYFAGKTIIITGAASGIGRAAALIFAREKANVVCADIDERGVEKTVEEINAIGGQALALAIDVTKRAAVTDMVQLAIDGFGGVQFLFNSAGAACAAAYACEQVRRDREHGKHGDQARKISRHRRASTRWPWLLGPLRRG
jgi:NAD(P)-dependent dehydrogenase (short-subunit alcohol dehydrogenase family)